MGVKFNQIFEDGTHDERNDICFSGLGKWAKNPKTGDLLKDKKNDLILCLPTQVQYSILVNSSLTSRMINFYLNFISQILDKGHYEFNGKVLTLNTKDLNYVKILLYLTTFRYLDEFYPAVSELFKFKEESIEKLFETFQKIHFELKDTLWNLDGHGLMYEYAWWSKDFQFTPISLAQFRKNLANNRLRNVQSFFKKQD